MSWVEVFFSAEGRIGRGVFLLAALTLAAVGAAAPLILPFLAPVIWLVSFYSWICVFAKRLHDLGRSAWLQTAPFLLGWILMSVGAASGLASVVGLFSLGPAALGAAALGGLLVTAGLFLLGGLVHLLLVGWLGVTPGQGGFNRYGPPPGHPLVETAAGS